MAQMKKPASKKVSNGSNTKPYNVKLMTPGELVGGKKPAPKKPSVKRPNVKPAQMPTKPKPAIGADKAAKKKYGPSSHNNGYTN